MFAPSLNTSGTYEFLPSSGEVIVSAYSRIQIRRTEITQSHMADAIAELNFLLSSMSNKINLWAVDLITLPITQGVATYSVSTDTEMILDMYIRISTGTSTIDRLLFPISRTEYSAIPNKDAQGAPSQYWFSRTLSPEFTLYLVPDGSADYTLCYYRFRQLQDAKVAGGEQPEIPIRFIDAVVAGLAHRLSRIYAPAQEAARKTDFTEAWSLAAMHDTENVNLYLIPSLGGYWRL